MRRVCPQSPADARRRVPTPLKTSSAKHQYFWKCRVKNSETQPNTFADEVHCPNIGALGYDSAVLNLVKLSAFYLIPYQQRLVKSKNKNVILAFMYLNSNGVPTL